MLLQSPKALCLAPGGPGSIWNYMGAPVRSAGVSWRFACGFRTDLHFADVPSIALIYSHQSDSEGGYKTGLQAEYQAGFRLGSDKVFKCQQALQWTPYCYNSHVVTTGIPLSLATSLI
jgi:hypothetical protein